MQFSKSYREELHHAGYDLEEEYFARINADLIARLREDRGTGRMQPVACRRASPSPPPTKVGKWLNLIFRPLPTGIYSFPV